MSQKTQNTKIAPSSLEIPAKTKSIIKTYVEHGYIKVNGEHITPKNFNEAVKLISPKINKRTFKMYVTHVERELRKAHR